MYKLVQFDNVTLPPGTPRINTAPTALSVVETLGGAAYDAVSGQARPRLPWQMAYACRIVNRTILGATSLGGQIDTLRGLRGREGKLWRTRMAGPGDDKHWALARLLEVEMVTEADNVWGRWQPLTLHFLIKSLWHGELMINAELEDDSYEVEETDAVTVVNYGNAPARPKISFQAAAGDVEYLRLRTGLCELEFVGKILEGKWLVMDTERQTVRNDGAPAYNDFLLGANHQSDVWLELQPGSNEIEVEWVGGGLANLLAVQFYNTWE